MDELLAAGLLTGDGAALKFRHEIARLAVQDAVPAHRRGIIHARILDALRRSGGDDDARMAFHAEGAGDGPAVLRYAPAAARRAAELGAHREAAAQYERALRFADGADPAAAARLYDAFGYEASLLDRWQDAVEARERALALWREEGDQRREGDTLRWLACALNAASRGSEGPCRGRGRDSAARTAGTKPGAGLGLQQPRRAADGQLRARGGDRAGPPGRRPSPGRWAAPTSSATRSTPRPVPSRGSAVTGPPRCAGPWIPR